MEPNSTQQEETVKFNFYKRIITTALLRDLERQVATDQISYSKMVEILNDKAEDYASLRVSEKMKRVKEILEGMIIQNPILGIDGGWNGGLQKALSKISEDGK